MHPLRALALRRTKNNSRPHEITWLNGEADLIGVLAHDLDGDQRGLGNLLTRVSAVGEDPLDEREDMTRGPQKRSAAIAVLDARRMRFKHEAAPIRIDEGMALTPVDLFPGIVAARPASLSRLDARLEKRTSLSHNRIK